MIDVIGFVGVWLGNSIKNEINYVGDVVWMKVWCKTRAMRCRTYAWTSFGACECVFGLSVCVLMIDDEV